MYLIRSNAANVPVRIVREYVVADILREYVAKYGYHCFYAYANHIQELLIDGGMATVEMEVVANEQYLENIFSTLCEKASTSTWRPNEVVYAEPYDPANLIHAVLLSGIEATS